MLRGILTLALALVSLPLTILYFLIRLTVGSRKPKACSAAQARRLRSNAAARSEQIRADAYRAALARRQAQR